MYSPKLAMGWALGPRGAGMCYTCRSEKAAEIVRHVIYTRTYHCSTARRRLADHDGLESSRVLAWGKQAATGQSQSGTPGRHAHDVPRARRAARRGNYGVGA